MRCVVSFLRFPRFASSDWFSFQSVPQRIARKGFKCLIYLDDLLILMKRNSFAKRRVKMILAIFECFGLSINFEKSNLAPS